MFIACPLLFAGLAEVGDLLPDRLGLGLQILEVILELFDPLGPAHEPPSKTPVFLFASTIATAGATGFRAASAVMLAVGMAVFPVMPSWSVVLFTFAAHLFTSIVRVALVNNAV